MAVLENLSEDECALVAILEDLSGLDIAEFILSDAQYDETDGRFRAYPYQWKWWRNMDTYQIDACVAEDQLVLTDAGWVPIQDVGEGDQVWTHKNRWRTVTKTWRVGERDVVSVVGHGHRGLTVTPDHKLYARKVRRSSGPIDGHKKKSLGDIQWLAPEDWEWSDGSQILTSNWASPSDFGEDGLVPSMERLPNTQYVISDTADLDWLWLVGLFLAEGGFAGDSRTEWSVHPAEALQVIQRMKRLGLNPQSRWVKGVVGCTRIAVNSRSIHDWMRDNVGSGVYEKSIPTWMLSLPVEQKKVIFQAACFGDGYFRNGGCEYTTVSKKLAYGMKLLAQSIGWGASVSKARDAKQHIIESRVVNCRETWNVATRPQSGIKDKVVFDGGMAWSALSTVKDDGRAVVYDLEVEEDHSFVVEGIVVHNCARDVGKTMGIMLNALAFPFCYPGEEMAIVGPEYVHLEPVVRGIDDLMKSTRLTSEMLMKVRGGGVKYKPFVMRFENKAKILGKIPQRDGKGIKGTHATVMHFEEAQDMPKAAWIEAQSALRNRPNRFWKAHGVTKGIQDDFWKRSQPGSSWTTHVIVAMNRLTWDADEKAKAEEEYGSQDDPDYRRNILGEHGDATSALFVQSRFMKNVDDEEESSFNLDQFASCRITDEILADENGDIARILERDIPAPPPEYGNAFWMGADLGWSRDPTEIVVFAEGTLNKQQKDYRKKLNKTVPPDGMTVLTLIAKIHMKRITAPDQAAAFDWLINHYGSVRACALDATGAGEPLVQFLQKDYKHASSKVKGYKFGSKVLVGYREVAEDEDVYDEEELAESEMHKAPDLYAIDVMRTLIDQGRLWIPFDQAVIQGFIGQTSSTIQLDQYGTRKMGKGPNGHVFDALRMAAVGWKLHTLEQLTKEAPAAPVVDIPVYDDDFAMEGFESW